MLISLADQLQSLEKNRMKIMTLDRANYLLTENIVYIYCLNHSNRQHTRLCIYF